MSRRSVLNRELRRDKPQVQPPRLGDRGELDLEHAHEVGYGDVGNLRLHRSGVEARNIEKRAQNLLDCLERDIDVTREIRSLLAADLARALAHRARVEPCSIERLENVVARGGKKAGLGEVRLFGDRFRAGELGVEALQFGGALVDPLLQQFVRGLERLLGLNGLRHVGVGGDDAAVGQPGRSHFEHAVG